MAEARVVIYSTPTCPHCTRAKEFLSQKGVPYKEHNVAADREAAKEMVEKSQQMGVPVTIFDGGDLVVGFAPEMYEELLKKNNII